MASEDSPVVRVRPSALRDGPPPHRILLLGDFSGRGSRQEQPNRTEPPSIVSVDLDNLDQVLARLRPTLSVSLLEAERLTATIEIRSLDDFHPDTLFQKLETLDSLRTARQRLLDGASDAVVSGESVERPSTATPAPPGEPAETESSPQSEDDAATVERLLGRRPAAVSQPSGRQKVPDLTAWLKQVVDPHVVPAADPRREELLKTCDQAATLALRSILHQPAFQALESLWRSVDWIVRESDTGGRVEFDLLDVSRAELATDFRETADWRESRLYRRLTGEGRSWSLLVGDFAFGTGPDDVLLLASLGGLAAELGAPWLSAAKLDVCGCRSVDELTEPQRWPPVAAACEASWQKLRKSDMARWLGLALPRVLLRLPYGAATDPIDQFPFEEMTTPDNHDELLWGNPAFACVHLIARAIAEGRSIDDAGPDLDDLPAYTFQNEEGPQLKACSEVYLSDRAAEAVLARGVMPLVSHRNRNAVRLLRWQSLAEPPCSLDIRT